MPLNKGQILAEYEALGERIENYVDPRPGWRKQREALNTYITADGSGEESVMRVTRTRRLHSVNAADCLVPECGEPGTYDGRCKRHHSRWIKSESVRMGEPGAIKCEICPPELGQWVKGKAGLTMHNRTWHPELVGVSA